MQKIWISKDRKRQYHVNGNQKKVRVSSINVKEKKSLNMKENHFIIINSGFRNSITESPRYSPSLLSGQNLIPPCFLNTKKLLKNLLCFTEGYASACFLVSWSSLAEFGKGLESRIQFSTPLFIAGSSPSLFVSVALQDCQNLFWFFCC